MALMKSATRTRAGSNSTVAVLVARFTLARVTPLVEESVRSIERAQAAQVMPETGRSMRSAVFTWRTPPQFGGRTPWSARDALVPPPEPPRQPPAQREQADGGVGRWSARPPLFPPPKRRRQPPANRERADGGVGRGPAGPPSHSCRSLSSRYLVAQLPHCVGQALRGDDFGVVLHGGLSGAQIHRHFRHAPRAGQFPLHAARAVSASHAMDGKAQGLNRHTYMMSHVRQMDA